MLGLSSLALGKHRQMFGQPNLVGLGGISLLSKLLHRLKSMGVLCLP
jgi:hypothetical protein